MKNLQQTKTLVERTYTTAKAVLRLNYNGKTAGGEDIYETHLDTTTGNDDDGNFIRNQMGATCIGFGRNGRNDCVENFRKLADKLGVYEMELIFESL